MANQKIVTAPAVAMLIVCMAGVAFGQSAALPPVFEVASIKPAPPQAPGRVSTRMSSDPARLNYTNVSISDVIGQAYRVQHHQIAGPAWLDTERFNIVAKIPAGVASDQIPQMFQALLADRFKLKLHKEKKELPVYALVAGKNGPKLQKAESSSGLDGGISRVKGHVSGKVSMARFAEYLSLRLGHAVLDQTELDGAYTVALDWVPDSTEEPGAAASSQPGTPDGGAVGATGPSLFTALQEQLGLKLVATKGPMEVLVIDRVEKVPTEN
jgi:uncharacterized protein (TIGR03435 family)